MILSRFLMLTFIVLVSGGVNCSPLHASAETQKAKSEKEVRVIKTIEAFSLKVGLESVHYSALLESLANVSDTYLNHALISNFMQNKKWDSLGVTLFCNGMLEIPEQSFEPLLKAILKITLAKPLSKNKLFGNEICKWDAKVSLRLLNLLAELPADRLDKAVNFIVALNSANVWDLEHYAAVIASIRKIPEDKLDQVILQVTNAIVPQKKNNSQLKKLDFVKLNPELNHAQIIDYFCATSESERKQIGFLTPLVKVSEGKLLEQQAVVQKGLGKCSDDILEILVPMAKNLSVHGVKLNLEEIPGLIQSIEDIDPLKRKTIADAVGKITEGQPWNKKQLIWIAKKLNQISLIRTERFLTDALPLFKVRISSADNTIQMLQELFKCSPGVFKSATIWVCAALEKQPRGSKVNVIPSIINALKELGDTLPDRLETIAHAAAKIHEHSARFKDESYASLAGLLNKLPTNQIGPIVDLALLANSYTTCLDSMYLIDTLDAMINSNLHFEHLKFISEILSTKELNTFEEKSQWHAFVRTDLNAEFPKIVPNLRGVVQIFYQSNVTRLIPKSQIQPYLFAAIDLWNRDRARFKHKYRSNDAKSLKVHAKALLSNHNQAEIDLLFSRWHQVLLSGSRSDAKILVKMFNEKPYLLNGAGERFREVLLAAEINLGFEASQGPYDMYEGFKSKKTKKIDWSLKQGKYIAHGWLAVRDSAREKTIVSISLCPKGIYKFSKSMCRDFSQVPDVSNEMFVGLLRQLDEQADQTYFSDVWNVAELKALIQSALNVDSHMQILIGEKTNSMPAAYLKCIINHFATQSNSEEKWLGLARVLSSVRGCYPGQEAAIEKLYFFLSPQMPKFVDANPKFADRNYAIYEIINRALQQFCMERISEESDFMRRICDLHGSQVMHEPSHQIAAVKGLIGDYVGLPYALKFDQHAGALYPVIRSVTCQNLLESYYSFIQLKPFVKRMRGLINAELSAPENQNTNLSGKLYGLLEEDAEASLQMKFKNDDDVMGEFEGLSRYGVVCILNKVGIIEPYSW